MSQNHFKKYVAEVLGTFCLFSREPEPSSSTTYPVVRSRMSAWP